MAVITPEMEDVPVLINYQYDGVIMLSSEAIFFYDAQPRLDGRKIYHVFERPENSDDYDDEFLPDEKNMDDRFQLFSKASEENIQTIQNVLESNGISFDEWCPPITPLHTNLSSQASSNILNDGRIRIYKRNFNRDKVNCGSVKNMSSEREKLVCKKAKIKNVSTKNGYNKESVLKAKFKNNFTKNGKSIFKCSKCKFLSISKGSLKMHQITHLGVKALSCSLCNFKTNYRASLKGHLLSVHEMSTEKCLKEVARLLDLNGVLSFNDNKLLRKGKSEGNVNKKIAGKENKFRNGKERNCKTDVKESSKAKKERVMNQKAILKMKNTQNGLSTNQQCLIKEATLKKSPIALKMNTTRQRKSKYCKLKALRLRKRELNKVDIKLLHCSNCKYKTREKALLKQHILKNHKRRRCSECKFSCESKTELEGHIATHSEYKCSKCQYSTHSKIRLMKHENLHDEVTRYNCKECGFVSNVIEDLLKHESKHNKAKDKVLKCADCNFECRDEEEMSQHDLNHMEVRLFRCRACNFSTDHEQELVEHHFKHFKYSKKGERIYFCSRCSFKSNFKTKIRTHETTHSIKIFRCPECVFTCLTEEEMSQHELNHLDVALFRCKMCNYATNVEQDLVEHNFKHPKGKFYSCSRCKYKSVLKASVKQHELTHSKSKSFTCELCDYSTNYPGNLKLHERNNHIESKKYNCSQCKYATDFKSYLDLHSVSHLEGDKFQCMYCSFTALLKTELRNHLPKHQRRTRKPKFSEPKELMCEECSFITLSRVSFNQHKLTHSTVKKFKCPHCDHACNFKANLEKHIGYKHPEELDSASHLEGNEIQCMYCEYITNVKTELQNHLAKYHISRINSETKSKELKCEDCAYKTSSRVSYNQHKLTHSTVKKFKCPHCPHACNFKANLLKHIGYKHPKVEDSD